MSGDRHAYLNALARSPMLTTIVVRDGVLDAGLKSGHRGALPVAVVVVVRTRR